MEIFVKILQGSYAYLLIFQVLVVGMLLLSLIWLVIRRTQEAVVGLGSEPTLPISPPIKAMSSAPVIVQGVPEAEVNVLKSELAAAREENDSLKSAGAELKSLREKVKYLESRLLEYEILQEEIGTLSQLKLENERLKEEIVHIRMETEHPAESSATPAELQPKTEAAVAPERAPDSPPLAVIVEAPPPTPPNPSRVEQALLTDPVSLMPERQQASASEAEALQKGEAAAAGLASLLDQIDKLTAPPNE